MNNAPAYQIVYQAPWNWSHLWNRAQPLATALSQTAKVIYINNWAEPSNLLQKFQYLQNPEIGLKKISEQLAVYEFQSLPFPGYKVKHGNHCDRPNSYYHLLAQVFKKILDPKLPVVLLTSRPRVSRLIHDFKWDCIGADIEDPWLDLPWGGNDCAQLTKNLLSKANFVTVNGQSIKKTFNEFYPRPYEILLNGIDPSFTKSCFAKPPEHPLISKIPKDRRVFFGGHLDGRLDISLLYTVFSKRSDFHLILVGKDFFNFATSEKRKQWSQLTKLPNVHLHKPIPHGELPSILCHSDILSLPYIDEGALKMFPGKLFEYLSTQSKIIASRAYNADLPRLESMQSFKIATNADEWLQLLEQHTIGQWSVNEMDIKLREQIIEENQWSQRAKTIDALVRIALFK